MSGKINEKSKVYPILALRNTVLFPHQIILIYIGRKHSLKLIKDISKKRDKHLIALAQEDGSIARIQKNYIRLALWLR